MGMHLPVVTANFWQMESFHSSLPCPTLVACSIPCIAKCCDATVDRTGLANGPLMLDLMASSVSAKRTKVESMPMGKLKQETAPHSSCHVEQGVTSLPGKPTLQPSRTSALSGST